MKHQRTYSVYHCLMMHRIRELIPELALLIEARNEASEFETDHDKFYAHTIEEEEYDTDFWKLKGKKGSLSVQFERHEWYLHFHVHTESKVLKDQVEKHISNYLDTVEKKVVQTTPILPKQESVDMKKYWGQYPKK